MSILKKSWPGALLIAAFVTGPVGPPASAAVAITTTAARDAGPSAGAKQVTLPTGEQVLVTGQNLAGDPAHGLVGISYRGRNLVMPGTALRYLGRTLDPSLFDVQELARTQSPSGRTQLHLTYDGPKPDIPGVTITSAAHGRAVGYLTPASAGRFGQALTQQWQSDHTNKWTKSDSQFGGATRISAADSAIPAAPARTVQPAYPQHTLTMKVTGPDGRPDSDALIQLMNTDDADKVNNLEDFTLVKEGEARFSVPAGHYAALVMHDVLDDDQAQTEHARVAWTEFTVKGDTSTAVDLSKATLFATPTVPRPAALAGTFFGTVRSDAGDKIERRFFWLGPGDSDFSYAPAAPTRFGTLDSTTAWLLTGDNNAYSYDLATHSQGISARRTYPFTAGDLTTIATRYYSDTLQHAAYSARYVNYPHRENDGGSWLSEGVSGKQRTEYVGATGKPQWHDEYTLRTERGITSPYWYTVDRVLKPGAKLRQDWNRGPIGTALPYIQEGHDYALFYRTKTGMVVNMDPTSDSDLHHTGDGALPGDGLPYDRLQIFAGGKLLSDEDDTYGSTLAGVTAARRKYRIVYDFDNRKAESPLSVRSHTEIAFTSKGDEGRRASKATDCSPIGKRCRFLPVVQARLSLPVDLQGRLPVGKSTIRVSILGQPNGAAVKGKSAVFAYHPTNSVQWKKVVLSPAGHNVWKGTVTHLADDAGRPVDVRFGATAANGSSFTQTVVHGYIVAGEAK